MEHKTKIRFPVFGDYTVHLIVTNDITSSRQKYDYELGIYDDDPSCTALHSYPADGSPSGYLFFHTDWLEFGTVAHEAWHCVRAVMQWAGARLENEVVAYHLGYTVTEIHKFLQKKNITVSAL